MKKISNINTLILPVGAIFIVVVIAILLANFLLGRIGELNSKSSVDLDQQSQLQQKLESLQKIDPTVLSESANAYLSLPDKNPAVYVISQLKKYASEYGVTLTKINISGSGSPQAELSSASVQFGIEGEYQKVVDLIDRLSQTAPIMSIDRVKITQSSLIGAEAQGTLNTYWAPFPKTLPSLTESVSNLTEDELAALEVLTSLEQPSFGELPPASSASARANPFAVQ